MNKPDEAKRASIVDGRCRNFRLVAVNVYRCIAPVCGFKSVFVGAKMYLVSTSLLLCSYENGRHSDSDKIEFWSD